MPSLHEKPHATNLSLYPTMFHLLHDGTMNFSSGLDNMPWHHSSWTGLPFLLSYFFMAGRFCINDVTAFIILFFVLKCRHLFFRTSLHSSLLVGDYVCGLSYKSNAIVRLETFHKEYSYWQVLMHDHATTLANTTFIHISLKLHLYQDNIEIVH